MTGIAMAVALAIAMMGQDPAAVVQGAELPPPGQDQPQEQQSQTQGAPAVPEPTEAQSIRRTYERPQRGRSVAAFWFVD